MKTRTRRFRLSPSLQIILGFLIIILTGALLISLPISNTNGQWLNLTDSLFTSTSAVCVTGLIVVDTATHFTLFGQIVILFLIQIGGLGIVAVTSLIFLILRKKINLYNRLTIQESLNRDTIQGVVGFIKKTIILTLMIEFVGVLLLLYSTITYTQSFWKGVYYAIFMSISSFCNAGFDVLGTEATQFTSLCSFANNVTLLLPIMMLVILGGIGFVVLIDGLKNIHNKQHTKVVLIMTAILIFGGAILFMLLEWNNPNTIGNMSVGEKILNCFFQSISPRTGGIATVDQSLLTSGSRILTMILMFIGAAPNSVAGGIKVTTLFIIILFLFRLPNESGDIRLKDKKVSRKNIMKAFRIVSYTIFTLVIAIILIMLFEGNNFSLESIVFECISAISTVGLTMGVTPMLSIPSKILITLLMFAGRVGLTTLAMAISSRALNASKQEIEFPNTDIIIG